MPAKRPWISRSWRLLHLTFGTGPLPFGKGPLTFGTEPLTSALLRCIQQVPKRARRNVAINESHRTNLLEGSKSKDFILNCQVSDWLQAKFGYVNVCKCRTTITFQDYMWNLPWKKHRSQQWPVTAYMLHSQGSHAETSFPNWVAICFSPGLPGLRKYLRCGSRPHQRVCEVVTPPAATRTTQQRGLLSFISQLFDSVIIQTNKFDGLVGFEGGGKSLSVLKTAAWETYTGRRISPSYQLRSVFGLLKASYFHAYFLRGSKLITATNCGTTETPPAAATRPWLPYHQSGCRSRGQAVWWSCWHAGHRPRPGRSGKQSVKRMTRGKNRNQRISEGAFW